MHFWPVYLYARFITPLIVWLRKTLRKQQEGRKLYVGPRFMRDTERVKFYPSLGDAMQAAGPNDTIVLRGKETHDRHAGQN